jgi:hypothetical protein
MLSLLLPAQRTTKLRHLSLRLHTYMPAQIPMNPNSTTSSSPSPGSSPLAVDRIVLGTADPLLLLAACADATLRLFDLRASRTSALVLAPFRQV